MEVSYNKLWKLMIDKGMSNKSDLRKVRAFGWKLHGREFSKRA